MDDIGFDKAPDRYMVNGREAIDIVREELGDGGCYVGCLFTARLYELRAGRKGDPEVDREKARWFREFAEFLMGSGPDPRAGRSA